MAELAGRMDRAEQSPAPGEMAVDFNLELLTTDGSRSGEYICLSSFSGKTLGLVFGSYTCPYFRKAMTRLNEIYDMLNGPIEFLGVYIREAHTIDGRQAGPNVDDRILYNKPTTSDERANIARNCITHLGPNFRLVIDDLDDSTEGIYKALPLRLYIIDKNGLVNFRSGPGPHFFDPEEWYVALKFFYETNLTGE